VPGSTLVGLVRTCGVPGILCLLAMGCHSPHAQVPPSVEFTRLPPAGQGDPEILNPIEGRVTGARPGQRIVLFARSGVWWVQPVAENPFTKIQADSQWKGSTHPGSAYAALLVDSDYKPPLTANALPQQGGMVSAVATAEGAALPPAPPDRLHFSGYEWIIRRDAGTPGGSRNLYDIANASVDQKGFLHLRVGQKPAGWTSAEVYLPRSLGYGSYRFTVSDVSHLEPALALTISTWDDSGPYREMDVEISRWGEPVGKNAQFVVQPYFIPANVVRFLAPAGRLTYSFDWEPGRVSFRALRGLTSAARSDVITTHVFTSGVPSPGKEAVHLNFYVFDNRRSALRHGVEVIIEKFEYLP
jgi:hypothetical protein